MMYTNQIHTDNVARSCCIICDKEYTLSGHNFKEVRRNLKHTQATRLAPTCVDVCVGGVYALV